MNKIQSRRINHPVLIGLFVVLSISIIAITMLWLGASKIFEEQKFYVTYFEGSVEGLEKGSSVKYLGVPVGTVEKIGMAADHRLIEIMFQVSPNVAINDSIRVKMALAGIAGGKFLQLHYTDNPIVYDLYPAIDFDIPEDAISYVKSAPSDFDEMTLAAQDVINNLKRLEIAKISRGTVNFLNQSSNFLDSATQFLSSEELQGILLNLEESTVSLKAFMKKTEESTVIEDVREAANNLYITSQYLKNFSNRLNTQIDSMNLVSNIDRTFQAYDTVMTSIDNTVNNVNYRTESLMLTLETTLIELNKTNQALRNTILMINENPGVLLTKPPKKKE